MLYNARKNMGTQRAIYRDDDAAGSHRIVCISGLWKAQERNIASDNRQDRKQDCGGWSDIGRLTSKAAAARIAGFSGREARL